MQASRLIITLSLIGLGLTACQTQNRASLVSENDIPELEAMKVGPEAALTFVRTSVAGDRIDLATYDIGPDHPARTVVLLHGLFADSSTWRFLIGRLSASRRVIMIDLPGSGLSGCPDARDAPCGPDALAERVLQAIGQLDNVPTGPITIMGHSLGGMTAIRMMGSPALRQRHAGILDQVDSLVLIAPADFETVNTPQVFEDIARTNHVQIIMADAIGLLEPMVVRGTRASFVDPERALREEAEQRLAILRDRDRFEALQSMLRQAVPMKGDRLNWDAAGPLIAEYANVQVPCLIVWGARDETLSNAMGYKLAAQLPEAHLELIADSRHSPHIEQPQKCLALVEAFLRARHLTAVDTSQGGL